MFDADDRYKQIEQLREKNKKKTIRVNLSVPPNNQRQIEDFRIKHELNGNIQSVILWIIEFASAFEEMADRCKKDPSVIFALKKETNKRKIIDYIYDNYDKNETEVIRDACNFILERMDDYELRRSK